MFLISLKEEDDNNEYEQSRVMFRFYKIYIRIESFQTRGYFEKLEKITNARGRKESTIYKLGDKNEITMESQSIN